MAIQVQGNGGTVSEVDATHRALHITHRPIEVEGAYRMVATSLEIAAGAGAAAEVFAFRNPSATKTALIKRVRISVNTVATGFTAGIGVFEMKVARSFTAAPTDGTTVTLTTNNCKLATAYDTAACAAYVADTSVLTSGTETADSTAIAAKRATFPTTVQASLLDDVLFEVKPGDDYLELAENEGFIVYATVPATGTWYLAVTVDWVEVLNATW